MSLWLVSRIPLLMISVLVLSTGIAQQPRASILTVAGAAVPLYPPLARAAQVQGVVHVKITTDGTKTTAVHAEDGLQLLAVAAEENARTWQFAKHEPTSFTVTYRYRVSPD